MGANKLAWAGACRFRVPLAPNGGGPSGVVAGIDAVDGAAVGGPVEARRVALVEAIELAGGVGADLRRRQAQLFAGRHGVELDLAGKSAPSVT